MTAGVSLGYCTGLHECRRSSVRGDNYRLTVRYSIIRLYTDTFAVDEAMNIDNYLKSKGFAREEWRTYLLDHYSIKKLLNAFNCVMCIHLLLLTMSLIHTLFTLNLFVFLGVNPLSVNDF